VSWLGRVAVSYTGADDSGPTSLVIKLAPRDPARRESAANFRIFEREVCIYRDLAAVGAIPAPTCYFAALSADGREFALLLEDLSDFPLGDDLRGLDADQAGIVTTALAEMHRSWWEAPALDTAGSLLEVAAWHRRVEAFSDYWPSFLDGFGNLIPADARRFGPACAGTMHRLLDELSARPVTLVHGDLKPSNLFFPAGAVKMIDWQFAGRHPGAWDMSYLLAIGLPVEERRKLEWGLLHTWHERLGPQVRGSYSYQDAVSDYRRSAVMTCLVNPVVGSQHLDLSRPTAKACFCASVTNRFVAALDLGLDDVLL